MNFLNINPNEKEYRDAEFRICRIGHEINEVERRIKDVRERIRRLKSGIDEML